MKSQWHFGIAACLVLVFFHAGSPPGAADEMRKAKARPQNAARPAVATAREKPPGGEAKNDEAARENSPASDETPQSLRKKLLARAEVAVEKVPLQELIEKLSKEHDIPLRIDKDALKAAGIPVSVPITANIKKGTLNTVLKRVLAGAGLRAVVRDKEVLITTADAEVAPAENREADNDAGEKKAAVKAAVRVRAAAEDQQLDQQAMQFLRQFQVMEKAELYFLSELCGIDREVTKKLKVDSETRAKAAARAFAGGQQRMMRGQAEGGGYLDARRTVQEGILEVLKREATPEQVATYEKQVAERAEYRKGAAVRNLTARLDRELVLSKEQREKFLDVLTEKWDDNWGRSMQLFMYGEQFYPAIPDAIVLPHLDAAQKEIWRGLQRQQHNIFFNGLGMMGNEIEDFPWDDPDGPAAPQGQPAPAAAVEVVPADDVQREDEKQEIEAAPGSGSK